MSERYIRIVGFGIINSEDKSGVSRQAIFKDEKTGADAEYLVKKDERPGLWLDIEKLEKGESIPPYKGYVTQINNADVVVFEDDDLEDAFKQQKKQLNIKQKLNHEEAEAMRKQSTGYATNLTTDGLLEISWKEIESNANMIKYRRYIGGGDFVWGDWYEILQD